MTRRSATLVLHFIVLLFGATAIIGKLIELPAGVLVWYRMGLAVIGLALYLAFTKGFSPLGVKGRSIGLGVGILVALHWVCFFGSVKASTVSITLVTVSTGAFMSALIEPIFYRRGIRPLELLLGAVTVVGMVAIFRFEPGYGRGIILGLLAAFFAALFTVINGLLVKRYQSRTLSLWELGGGFMILTPYVMFSSEQFAFPSVSDWIYLLILAWLCTSFAFVASIAVMRQLSPFTVMLTNNLEPVYGIAIALVVFGAEEKMSLGFYAGAALILASVVADALIRRKMGEVG